MSVPRRQPIHQVVVTAAPGDAVTNSALEIQALLRGWGDSEVFACNVHEDLAGQVHTLPEYRRHAPRDARCRTLVHVSMGDERFLPFVLGLRGELILNYHNITPASYFAPWDPPTAERLKAGRLYLDALRERTVAALANSAFSAADLDSAGYHKVRVGGLILGTERLTAIEPAELDATTEGPIILSVGQLYPHKRPDLLIAAFHELLTRYRPEAHLVLAGSARLPAYANAVRWYVDRLGLRGRVTVTGHLSNEAIVAWYRRADVFVMASEHEGFCVPLVEAMQFDLPIVARANGAVAEVLEGAGALLPGDAGPSALAEVLAALLEDPAAQGALRDRGRRRRAAFSAEACRSRFLDALETVL